MDYRAFLFVILSKAEDLFLVFILISSTQVQFVILSEA